MINTNLKLGSAALVLAVAAASANAMPLEMRRTEPAVGARQSNTYHGPGSTARGQNQNRADDAQVGGGSEVDVAPASLPVWMRDQEVMSTRTGAVEFVMRIENIAAYDSMVFSDGSSQAAGMSHGVYAVHPEGWPVYEPDEETLPATGLEALAEDGNIRPMQSYLEKHPDVVESGIFYKPVGRDTDAELWPGDVYEVHFTADPGDKLSLATMLMQSNDLIYGPRDGRIELFTDDGRPVQGDITGEFALYDAGTEVNEDPKFGPNVGLNQTRLNQGVAETEPVRPVDDGFAYPDATQVLKVTISRAG
jgi:hypothetical protein